MTCVSTGVAYVSVVELLTLDQAQALVLERVAPLPPETVPTADAAGRVLAEPAHALVDLPAVPELGDGRLRRSLGGHAGDAAGRLPHRRRGPPPRSLAAGEAMGIATGGVVPDGADAVVQHEHVVESDNSVGDPSAVATGANIRPAGGDVAAGGIVAFRGRAAWPRADRRTRRRRDRRGHVRPPSPCRRPRRPGTRAASSGRRRSAPARSTRRTA